MYMPVYCVTHGMAANVMVSHDVWPLMAQRTDVYVLPCSLTWSEVSESDEQ
jgi:hypothetical protein